MTCPVKHYRYRLSDTDESSLEAFMIVDADNPGSLPPSPGGMEAAPGSAGVYKSRLSSRESVARRVHGAWLLVQSSHDTQQRLGTAGRPAGTVTLGAKKKYRASTCKHKKRSASRRRWRWTTLASYQLSTQLWLSHIDGARVRSHAGSSWSSAAQPLESRS